MPPLRRAPMVVLEPLGRGPACSASHSDARTLAPFGDIRAIGGLRGPTLPRFRPRDDPRRTPRSPAHDLDAQTPRHTVQAERTDLQ